MTDYKEIYIKWLAYFEIDENARLEIYNNFHEEIQKAFEIIVTIAIEELEHAMADKMFYQKIKSLLEEQFFIFMVAGYILYLITNKIDPDKENLKNRETTSGVGSEWMREYDKDQLKTLLEAIDPILQLFLYQQAENRMNYFFLHHPEIMHMSYKEVSKLEKIMKWTIGQGYIFGELEKKLQV